MELRPGLQTQTGCRQKETTYGMFRLAQDEADPRKVVENAEGIVRRERDALSIPPMYRQP